MGYQKPKEVPKTTVKPVTDPYLRKLLFFCGELRDENERARKKFPAPNRNYAALVEEVLEVTKAILDRNSPDDLRKELIQVASMCARLYIEGDPIEQIPSLIDT